MNNSTELTLVLGVDASGKSTFLDRLHCSLGHMAIEPTISAEARKFKIAHQNALVDLELVGKRRDLFRKLNLSFDKQISLALPSNNVATSGSRLVTEISHAVMSKIIGNVNLSVSDIIDDWAAKDILIPDRIVYVNAPMDLIRERICQRQHNGDHGEQLTGFNSLYFLSHYQETLEQAACILSTDHRVTSLDTSLLNPLEMVNAYSE